MTIRQRTSKRPLVVLFLLLLATLNLCSAQLDGDGAANSSPKLLRSKTVEAEADGSEQRQQQEQQRRELSFNIGFMSFLAETFNSVKHGCPPIGPAHHHCMSEATSSSTSYSTNSESEYVANSSTSSNEAIPSNTIPIGASSAPMWMLILAAIATAVAVGAVVKGLRRSEPPPHVLKGSVARRMGLFSQFADCALCSDAGRPQRVVEMTMSADDYEQMPPMSAAV